MEISVGILSFVITFGGALTLFAWRNGKLIKTMHNETQQLIREETRILADKFTNGFKLIALLIIEEDKQRKK